MEEQKSAEILAVVGVDIGCDQHEKTEVFSDIIYKRIVHLDCIC